VFRGEIAADEHRQLLDCALNRNAAKAQAVLVKHIQDCVTYTLSKGAAGLRPAAGDQTVKRRKTIAA
jgi:DNA-binding GntR family transcriptional regulator